MVTCPGSYFMSRESGQDFEPFDANATTLLTLKPLLDPTGRDDGRGSY